MNSRTCSTFQSGSAFRLRLKHLNSFPTSPVTRVHIHYGGRKGGRECSGRKTESHPEGKKEEEKRRADGSTFFVYLNTFTIILDLGIHAIAAPRDHLVHAMARSIVIIVSA